MLSEHALYDFTIQPEDLAAVQDVVTGKMGVLLIQKQKEREKMVPKLGITFRMGCIIHLGHMQTVREVLKTLVEIDQGLLMLWMRTLRSVPALRNQYLAVGLAAKSPHFE